MRQASTALVVFLVGRKDPRGVLDCVDVPVGLDSACGNGRAGGDQGDRFAPRSLGSGNMDELRRKGRRRVLERGERLAAIGDEGFDGRVVHGGFDVVWDAREIRWMVLVSELEAPSKMKGSYRLARYRSRIRILYILARPSRPSRAETLPRHRLFLGQGPTK